LKKSFIQNGKSATASSASHLLSQSQRNRRDAESEYIENEDESPNASASRSTNDASRANNFYLFDRQTLRSFGTKAMSYFNILPQPTFLIGSLSKEPIAKKQRAKRERAVEREPDELVKLKDLKKESKEDGEKDTIDQVERIHKILKRCYKRTEGEHHFRFTIGAFVARSIPSSFVLFLI
jgi:hypothetical protein